MSEGLCEVTFTPGGQWVRVAPGSTVREAASAAGVPLDYPCGGHGTCGKCRVRFLENAPEPTSHDEQVIASNDLAQGVRLACCARIITPSIVEVPTASLLAQSYKILTEGIEESGAVADPVICKKHVELGSPILGDDVSDLQRLMHVAGACKTGLSLLRELPSRLRTWGFAGTAVCADGLLLDFEEGDATATCVAAAFDIGTTTLVGVLVDCVNGAVLARASRLNPQTRHGDDVLARIQYSRENREGLPHLQQAVIGAINDMIAELALEAGVDREHIYEAVFAGNTTMQHLLAGVDPRALGEVPFVPATSESLYVSAMELGLHIHPRAHAYLFPIIGGFVGGDTVAGALAAHFDDAEGPVMLVDIGTNGEIAVKRQDRLWAASCAAGPAFEGARITHGMRAAAGAIEKIRLGSDVSYEVIGGGRPAGICGSALIDVAAELLRSGLLMPEGLLLTAEDAPSAVPQALRDRLIPGEDGTQFVIARAEETATGAAITLTQGDIRELQLATAAIRSAMLTLLKREALAPSAIGELLVAGAFGNYIRLDNAQRIGLLPPDVPREKVSFIGNSALTGARMAAMSRSARVRAERIARQTEHVELSLDPDFHSAYVEAMFFPPE